MSHPVFNLAAKNFKKPHIAKKMQPSPMQEHGSKKGQVIDKWETVIVSFCIFNWNNTEVIGELLKEFRWQGSFKQEDNPTQNYQRPRS